MTKLRTKVKIERFKDNPLIVPTENIPWMSLNAFNCGVVREDDGVWKMLIRGTANPKQLNSDLGLALSTDGIHWNILSDPVLPHGFNHHSQFGVEDPRIVKWIDEFYYVLATAYGPQGPRIGIWRSKNLLTYKWVGIPFDQDDKDAAIFPKPIGNWAYLLHRKEPHIWLSRTQDFTLKSGWKDSRILIRSNAYYPDPNSGKLPVKIGIGGPPIKTPKGWLVITHIVHATKDSKGRYRYSLSFMVLALDNPAQVIYVHPFPILWPEMDYEKEGSVPMVCFSNATVDPGGEALYIYYGGADTVICGGKLYKKDLPMCY